jgi:hypothetical protein
MKRGKRKAKASQPAVAQMMRMHSPVEVAFQPDGSGKPPTFTCNAYNGGAAHPYWPGHGDRPVVTDLAGISAVEPVPVLLDHWESAIVGQTSKLAITKEALNVSGIITGALDEDGPAKTVVTHARNGFTWRASVGLQPTAVETVESGETVKANGREFDGPLYVIRKSELLEISFLSIAADSGTSVKVAARKGVNHMDFEKWLAQLGFASKDLTVDQRTSLEAKFKAEQEDDSDDDEKDDEDMDAKKTKKASKSAVRSERVNHSPRPRQIDDVMAEAKAKRERRSGIETLMTQFAADYPDAIEMIEEQGVKAIQDETWTVRDFENHLLRTCSRSQRVDTTLRGSKASSTIASEEIEAGLCRAMGMRGEALAKSFSSRTLEASNRRWRHGLSLADALQFAAQAHGVTENIRTHTQEVLAAAMPPPGARFGAGGPSTYDVSGILGNVLNRMVVDYFGKVDTTAMMRITAVRPTRDFRDVESYAITSDMQFERLAPGGEIRHGSFGEQVYRNRAETFARMITITRQDIINDDIGALDRIAQALGRGGALALLHRFWTVFIANTAFFSTANGNFLDGAGTALDLDSLTDAKVLFNQQTDPNGKPMNISPRILLVPPELEATARTILQSQLIVIAGDADRTLGDANIHAGTLDLAMSRELSNLSYTGFSDKKWYLLAEPSEVPAIQTMFLNGVDRPTIENAQADFNMLGISLRGYFDFGVALQEPRAGVAMKGEA